ncbi:hypothetical protein GCM10008098_30570 [Rhodanobacter panaciterrae]|uniref:DUF192 domain-containing protein n=1 Tax=Rhodanobacter panaciterrae TaxID=490572 RepID=A0ABQ3A851_9GAMM|nr:DUF192 domain-containing protein [Rhodanobacter panaciterrae]GGY35221.1 hypothetical protein GCM10008098_30570 [Rhodanobacter panaciterrae]
MLLLLISSAGATQAKDTTPAVELHGQRFSVEFATDDASRVHGLMMRTTLAPDHSMLFVFSYQAPQAFWMKNTLIPLDILYFDTERRLVSMQLNVPPCKADPCPIYPSNAPARYVLELSAGTAHRIGAQAGDELKIDGDIGTVR